MRLRIARRIKQFNPFKSELATAVLWAAFLTLLIAGPWLVPGYLFGTDWPGPRRVPFPTDLSSSLPLQAVLAGASSVIGGEATGKLLILGCLFTAPLLAYRALPAGGFVAKAAASTVYVVNPFVYGRLHYGQLYLLAGYAVLPWVLVRLRRVMLMPRAITALAAAFSLVLLGILSLHLFFASTVLVVALGIAHAVAAKARLAYLAALLPSLLLMTVVALAASSYWIIPLVIGQGTEGATLGGIATGDLRAFAAVPDQHLGLLPNLFGLYGFWAEDTGRFTSMKHFAPLWPAALAGILLVSAAGVLAIICRRGDRLAPLVSGLVLATAIALFLESGVSNSLSGGVVQWLDANVFAYRGMRDAGKWAALVAISYSQFVGFGAIALQDWVKGRTKNAAGLEWATELTTLTLLALTFYYGNGLFFGLHGEIKPSPYPAGWYAADRVLAADSHRERAVFLPWHEYMGLSFVRNQNAVVGSPAATFFSIPVLVSANPEVPGISPPSDPDQLAISALVRSGDQGRWGTVLAARGIKFILLAREVDWRSYAFLDRQEGIVMIGDYGSVVLYRNKLVP